MRTRTVQFIQFFNYTEARDYEPDLYRMYPVCNLDSSAEFYESYQDDDGDEQEEYNTYDCVAFFRDMEDFNLEEDVEYVKSRRLRYNIIELEVECDENNKLIWNVA